MTKFSKISGVIQLPVFELENVQRFWEEGLNYTMMFRPPRVGMIRGEIVLGAYQSGFAG